MDLNKLYFFKVTAQLEHMTHAAEQLGVNQAFLSRSIQALERELDAPLFLRSGRGIVLSSFGRTYYRYVCSVFDALADGAQAVRDLRQDLSRTLRIGTNACSFLPSFFSAVRTREPGTSIRQRTAPLPALLSGLEQGEFDFVFAVSPRPPEFSPPLVLQPLLEEDMLLLLPAAHPLAGSPSLSFGAVADQPVITAPEGCGYTDCLLDQFTLHKTQPNVAVQTTDIAVIPQYVAAGLGLSAAPHSVWAARAQAGVSPAALADGSFRASLSLLWNEDRYQSKTAQAFLQLAMDHYRHAQ